MKDEVFVVIQNLKKSLFRWRVFALVAVCLLIIASSSGKIFKLEKEENKIIRIALDREITNNLFSEQKIRDLLSKDEVKGVILEINSAGGDVVESEKLYNAFRKLAIKKPLVVSINGICTSGAYMIAMASDYIIAYNTSVVGSIGVIVEAYEITELAKKLGISLTNYKTSNLKSALSPLEKITPDVDMVVSQQINDVYDYFLNIFIERRKIKVEEAQEIANGQAYTGRQALDFGLIDKIGGYDEIKEYFKINNLDLDSIKIVDYDIYNEKEDNFIKNLTKVLDSKYQMKLRAIFNY